VEAQQLSVPNTAVKSAIDMHIEALRQRWIVINIKENLREIAWTLYHENGASAVGELDGVRYREMHDSPGSWFGTKQRGRCLKTRWSQRGFKSAFFGWKLQKQNRCL
jgi:hypothetical protein